MQNETIFRFSDSDLSAYLLTLGYEPLFVEIKKDKKHFGRLKAFVHFKGNRETLIKIQNDYRNNLITIDLQNFSIARQKINKLIKNEMYKYSG